MKGAGDRFSPGAATFFRYPSIIINMWIGMKAQNLLIRLACTFISNK